MKIRHKQSGVELEGDFVRVNGSYFSVPLSIPHGGSCYAASEWEAVPEWVDVTGECVVYEENAISHGNSIRFVPHAATHNYRLRKVRLFHVQSGIRDAFIVERKA